MAICMKMDAGHIHDVVCDDTVSKDGRTTTVIAVRIPDVTARRIRELMANSPRGYGSVSEFITRLIETQGLRKR